MTRPSDADCSNAGLLCSIFPTASHPSRPKRNGAAARGRCCPRNVLRVMKNTHNKQIHKLPRSPAPQKSSAKERSHQASRNRTGRCCARRRRKTNRQVNTSIKNFRCSHAAVLTCSTGSTRPDCPHPTNADCSTHAATIDHASIFTTPCRRGADLEPPTKDSGGPMSLLSSRRARTGARVESLHAQNTKICTHTHACTTMPEEG